MRGRRRCRFLTMCRARSRDYWADGQNDRDNRTVRMGFEQSKVLSLGGWHKPTLAPACMRHQARILLMSGITILGQGKIEWIDSDDLSLETDRTDCGKLDGGFHSAKGHEGQTFDQLFLRLDPIAAGRQVTVDATEIKSAIEYCNRSDGASRHRLHFSKEWLRMAAWTNRTSAVGAISLSVLAKTAPFHGGISGLGAGCWPETGEAITIATSVEGNMADFIPAAPVAERTKSEPVHMVHWLGAATGRFETPVAR